VHHCEHHDVSFHGDFVRPASSWRPSLSSASSSLRKSRSARMRATSVAGITPIPSHPNDFNNLREFSFGTRIANQDVKSQRLLLGRSGSREGL
jgi:hypothetical protein